MKRCKSETGWPIQSNPGTADFERAEAANVSTEAQHFMDLAGMLGEKDGSESFCFI